MTKNKNDNSVAAGIAGVVIGAGAAIAASKVLAKKENRDKVNKTISGLKKQVMDKVHNAQGDAKEAKAKVEKRIVEGKKEIKEKVK